MPHTVRNPRRLHPPVWLALIALAIAPPFAPPLAAAERAPGDSEGGVTSSAPQAGQATRLREVLVTADRLPADSYAAARASVGGKSEVALRDIPQSVSVLTRQRIEDQNLIEATRALTWVTGLVDGRSNESDTPLISSRGFRVDNVTIDGSLAGATFWQVPSDLSMYEQVEVLRGPTGLFNGSGPTGSAGGAINLRRKRPQADALTRMEFAVGQWDHYRVTLDAGRPLSHQEVLQAIDPPLDRVTAYRVLDWLEEVGIAHRVNAADRILRFSISPQPHSHAHFQCERCGRVFCLPDALPRLPENLPAGFILHEVEMTVKGVCADCAR